MSQIRKLTTNELKEVFHTHMEKDFPPDELRPLESILELVDEENYYPFGYFKDDKLMAYAFFARPKNYVAALLDYYAVSEDVRGTGIGSKLLRSFADALFPHGVDHVVLEVEQIDKAENSDEENIRKRRIKFYEENGCKMSGIKTLLFDVDYNIMALPFNRMPSDETLFEEMHRFYRILATPLVKSEAEYQQKAQVFPA